MMIATVEMVYTDKTKNKRVDVEIKDGLKGTRLLNAVEKAVEKKMASDTDWVRWNLIEVK